MHFNLFATSMLLSMISAVEIEAMTTALLEDHPRTGVRPDHNGTVESLYHRPKDNCCFIYYEEKLADMREEPICWDLASGKPVYDQTVDKNIKGVDCGKNTWVDFTSSDGKFRTGTAGRQHFDMQIRKTAATHYTEFTNITVGPYDSRKMAAATLWRGSC